MLKARNIKSGAWTLDAFYGDRLAAENELARLLRMGRLCGHSHVVRGFEHLSDAIVDSYRDRSMGMLQVAFE
jgi:NADPH-dependent curcumin reductase